MNEKCKVNKNVKDMANTKSLNPQEVKEIANVLWDDVSLIDQYLIDQRTDIIHLFIETSCWRNLWLRSI